MHKRRYKMAFMIILALSSFFVLNGCNKEPEGLVAKVDGEEITEEGFNTEFESFKGLYEMQLGKDAMSQIEEDGRTREEALKEDILEKMIMDIIIEKESKKMDISVSQEELDEKIGEYVDATGGEREFEVYLEESNLTEEFFKENLRKELLASKHKDRLIGDIEITEEEAKEYFENNKEDLILIRVSHILVKTEEEGQEVLDRINNGEDFAKVAEETSVDKQSSESGGDLGYLTKGDRVAEFEEAAFSLEPGEISEIIKTEVGYHVIKAEDKRETYESLRDDIILLLKEERYFSEMERLRENAKIDIYNE